jgi:Rod binding domain-containing protein
MTNFALTGFGAAGSTPIDLTSVQGSNVSEQTKIEKVSKAMESIFVSELTAEMGMGIDGKPDPLSGGGQYQDFIQQAMSQAVSKGGGFGLAKMIQSSLTHTAKMAHPDLAAPTTPTGSTHASSITNS